MKTIELMLALGAMSVISSQTLGQFPAAISAPEALNTDPPGDTLEDYTAQIATDGNVN